MAAVKPFASASKLSKCKARFDALRQQNRRRGAHLAWLSRNATQNATNTTPASGKEARAARLRAVLQRLEKRAANNPRLQKLFKSSVTI